MDSSLSAALVTGFLLGMRHALDADHLAAVSALVSRHRSLVRSSLLGTFWGVGHTAALLAAGIATIVFKLTITPEAEKTLETLVALMLIALGGHVLLRSAGALRVHRHAHTHGDGPHVHVHVHVGDDPAVHDHGHLLRAGRRPLLVGLVHGLAGSAALMLLVLATIPSTTGAILYIVVFGVGSTLGMLLLGGVMAIPFAMAAARSPALHAVIQALAGAATLALGLALVAGTAAP